jgi:hypothetical protein
VAQRSPSIDPRRAISLDRAPSRGLLAAWRRPSARGARHKRPRHASGRRRGPRRAPRGAQLAPGGQRLTTPSQPPHCACCPDDWCCLVPRFDLAAAAATAAPLLDRCLGRCARLRGAGHWNPRCRAALRPSLAHRSARRVPVPLLTVPLDLSRSHATLPLTSPLTHPPLAWSTASTSHPPSSCRRCCPNVFSPAPRRHSQRAAALPPPTEKVRRPSPAECRARRGRGGMTSNPRPRRWRRRSAPGCVCSGLSSVCACAASVCARAGIQPLGSTSWRSNFPATTPSLPSPPPPPLPSSPSHACPPQPCRPSATAAGAKLPGRHPVPLAERVPGAKVRPPNGFA